MWKRLKKVFRHFEEEKKMCKKSQIIRQPGVADYFDSLGKMTPQLK